MLSVVSLGPLGPAAGQAGSCVSPGDADPTAPLTVTHLGSQSSGRPHQLWSTVMDRPMGAGADDSPRIGWWLVIQMPHCPQ